MESQQEFVLPSLKDLCRAASMSRANTGDLGLPATEEEVQISLQPKKETAPASYASAGACGLMNWEAPAPPKKASSAVGPTGFGTAGAGGVGFF